MNKLFYLLAVVLIYSCTSSSKTEKYQDKRDNIVNVRDKIKEIEIQDVLVSGFTGTCVVGDYLLISDYQSNNKFVNIFDKGTFKYITSAVSKGRGPGEIIRLGHVGVGDTDRVFYATDYGKRKLFRYDIDSILVNPQYMPSVKMDIAKTQFLLDSDYINDTLSIGLVLVREKDKPTKTPVAKLNMGTGEIKYMKYEHPVIEGKNKSFVSSIENDMYVECYSDHDLITICSFDGDLKCNIYGPNWNTQAQMFEHFSRVEFYDDKIFVSYLGDKFQVLGEDGKMKANYSTKILVFDTDGDYIKTLETGYQILSFCFDKDNNRMILSLHDAMQFAYLDLDVIID